MANLSKPFYIKNSDLDYILQQVTAPRIMIIGYDSHGKPIYGLVWNDASGMHTSELGPAGSFDPLAIMNPLDLTVPLYASARVADGLRDTSGSYNNLTQGWEAFGMSERPFMREMTHPDYSHYLNENLNNPAYTNFQILHGNPDNPTDNSAGYSNPQSHVVDYTPRMISQTIVNSGFVGNIPGNAYANDAFAAALQAQSDASAGIGDPQTFIRSLNSVSGDPGYSMWFVMFGQFFDHGLDFIGKPGSNPAKITVPLSPDDPLYGTIGPDGQPVRSLTITRATVNNQGDAGPDGRFGTSDDVGYSVGPDHIAGTNDDVYAAPKYTNHTSPFIDQSQTYGSEEQITLLLREWVADPNHPGSYIAGAALFDGYTLSNDAAWHLPDGTLTHQTLPTLDELRAHVEATARDALTWDDVNNYRARDAQGHVIDVDPATSVVQAALTGHSLLLDMLPHFDNAHITAGAMNTHLAADYSGQTYTIDSATAGGAGIFTVVYHVNNGPAITETLASVFNFATNDLNSGLSDAQRAVWGEVLMESVGDHYIAGDGRANENFALTAIHHVFHEDHNVQLLNLEGQILKQQAADGAHLYGNQFEVAAAATVTSANIHIGTSGGHYVATNGVIALDANDHYFVAGAGDALGAGERFLYASDGVTKIDATGNYTDAAGHISWDNERIFQGTKLIVEMEYQHVAIDQYARLITPDLPEFVTYDASLDASISLEYAEAAFRFGHSQLRDTIDALEKDASGSYDLTGSITEYGLAQAFLTPGTFADVGPTALALGLTREVGNETDEFVTPALQQSLLGQPLDLAAINIARGRDLGLPTLNEARKQIHDALIAERAADPNTPHHTSIIVDALTPYTSWNDFANNMIHPESLVNFIAAYAFDGDVAHAQAIIDADLNDVDTTYTDANSTTHTVTAVEAGLFLLGAKKPDGSFLEDGAGAFNNIDLWLGGLAEKHVYAGFLGPTFNAIFEDQMERLMDGDRFYYLYRLDGALPTTTELNQAITTEQFKDIIERTTDARHLNGDVMGYADSYVELGHYASDGGVVGGTAYKSEHAYGYLIDNLHLGVYSTGGPGGIGANGTVVGLTNPDTHITQNYIRDYRPDIGTNPDGTAAQGYNSHEVISGTDYNDWIDAGDGDDTIYGGAGDDVLDGKAGADHIYGEAGNDTIYGGDIDDFLDGGTGNDIIYAGSAAGATDVVIGGDGNDKLYGEAGIDEIHGDAGDDYIDAGGDTDLVFGDAGNDEIYGGDGPDTIQAGIGDDIVAGGSGPDVLWGEAGDDILMAGQGGGFAQGDGDELLGDVGFDVASFSDSTIVLDHAADLNQQNLVATAGSSTHYEPFDMLMTGLEGLVGSKFNDVAASQIVAGDKGLIGDATENWLIGGSGNDFLKGYGGNDVIVGDSIRLDVLDGHWHKTVDVADNDVLHQDSTGFLQSQGFAVHFQDLLTSRPDWVFGQDGGTAGTSDTAVFQGNLSDYTLIALDVNGEVVATPHANWASVFAIKVTDSVASRTLPDGVTVVPGDGTDLVIGVEQFKFADQTIDPQAYFDIAPSLDLAYQLTIRSQTIASDGFTGIGGNAYNRGTGWNAAWVETGDNGSATSGQIQVDNAASFLNPTLHVTGGTPAGSFDGATVSRSVNLAGLTAAQLSFDVRESGLTAGQTVKVYFSDNGAAPTASDVPLLIIDQNHNATGNNNFISHTYNLTGPFTAGATLYIVSSAMNSSNNDVYIDNLTISNQVQVDAFPGNNYTTSYTEQLTAAHVAFAPSITDPDDATVASARVVLRDAVAGDTLTVGSLPAGVTSSIDTSVAGKVTVTLSGLGTHAAYQDAIAAITFSSASDNPTNADRHIDVMVNDGLKDSVVATTTVHVTPVDDPTAPQADNIVTNFGTGVTISVPDWTLLANDVDPDSVPTIGSVNTPISVTNLNHSASTVTFQDNLTPGGSFKYHVNGTTSASDPTVTVTQDTTGPLDGTANADIIIGNNSISSIINGNGGNDIIIGNGGADSMTGGAGADTFAYLAISDTGITAATRDVITDFQSNSDVGIGHDTINLAAIDANTGFGQFGDQAFAFIDHSATANASPNFTGLGQLVYYLDNTGHYMLAGNTATGGVGPGGAEFVIDLGTTNKHLTAVDFVL